MDRQFAVKERLKGSLSVEIGLLDRDNIQITSPKKLNETEMLSEDLVHAYARQLLPSHVLRDSKRKCAVEIY